ncbi:glycosyltransferase [Bradyrhizobium sp. AUGA SZCCT0182]|uniref:glycosyltransferase family protein n=1 Tax=Bradyrhizobium sp. AUGA SZCCT0182 TaxID=2807667 RepID=UPI001BABAD98|nr:glycosyltransferase [Bradyrhizobium sp. AUGA SZCCT0182]MBR1232029.1 glycosyltransferase [Bradyrhizobium sp. AUGA SZCCT0182]
MKIAIQNSWPNLTFSAEREFIARVQMAGKRLGWSVVEVVTSDEIRAAAPDIVLVTHEFSPKLTPYPTVGLIWSPTAFFGPDPDRVRNILSYDGYLVANSSLRAYLTDLLRVHGKDAPIGRFDFLPSALATTCEPDKSSTRNARSLFYAGVHWDGHRHGDLFAALKGRIPMRIHGDPMRWQHAGKDFAGPLPFDGESVVDAIRECGIGLALHGKAHRAENIPSMRLFEATAAGAVVISDRLEFAIKEFGDALLYVDVDQSADVASQQIADHVSWINGNPELARSMADRGHAIFNERFALERILVQLPAFLEEVRKSMGLCFQFEDGVDIIIRVGSRPLSMIERAIESVAAQTHRHICLIVVAFRPIDGLTDLLDRHKERFTAIKIVEAPDNGVRSTPLWMGLRAASAIFVGNLDDDDVIHPNHVASLVRTLRHPRAKRAPLAYAGTIQVQEDDGHWYDQINFRGDRGQTIEERRQLRFLEPFDARKMLQFENFIQSNAWLARRAALTSDILLDPELIVAEDVYLYLTIMLKGPFVASWRPTAEWNWRSTMRDNVMFSPELWGHVWERLHQKLTEAGVSFEPEAIAKSAANNNRGPVHAFLRSSWKFLYERELLISRTRFALGLLRRGSARILVLHILRFGRR